MSRRKRPKAKQYARWVCVISRKQARSMGPVSISYRCRDASHAHYKREQVDELVTAGEMEWVGDHCRVATFSEHKIWAKTPSGPVHTMQLVEPAEVYGRRKRQ
jgi:hypothetical protein